MDGCNPCHVPMEARLKLSNESHGDTVDVAENRSLMGSLRYLVNTRPALAYSVGYLESIHGETNSWPPGCCKAFVGDASMPGRRMRGHCQMASGDSDMGGDLDDRKSTTGTEGSGIILLIVRLSIVHATY
uniref:Uncharacterized protein n=1 Tax=Oryza brachyantha TaxID=4533 RepID=J3N790_ORYBR